MNDLDMVDYTNYRADLRHEDRKIRRQTVENLGDLSDAMAIPLLAECLRDADWLVRRSATVALCARGTAALPALVAALADADISIHTVAVQGLGKAGAVATPLLTRALKDPNSAMRSGAGETLGKIGDVCAIPALMEGLRDRNEVVRRETAYARAEGDSH